MDLQRPDGPAPMSVDPDTGAAWIELPPNLGMFTATDLDAMADRLVALRLEAEAMGLSVRLRCGATRDEPEQLTGDWRSRG